MITKRDLAKYKTLMVKSNYIIEASYKLNLQEQRLIYILTSKINKDDIAFKPYKFTQKEINSILSKHKITLNELVQHINSLRNRELIIIKENSILNTKWLSSAEYFDDGSIELCFDDKLKPYLLQLKDRFTKLNLNRVVTFNSNYACRIYELLKQYEVIGERTISIEALRTMFCIAPEEYKLYGDFKRKVILQAQKEINKSSDICFDFEELKTGRKVTSIKFTIHTKRNSDISEKDIQSIDNIDHSIIIKSIIKEHITSVEANKIMEAANGDIEKIKEKYAVISKLTKVDNVVGAMLTSLKEDWKVTGKIKKNNFTDYDQREYDYEDLEKKLLGWD